MKKMLRKLEGENVEEQNPEQKEGEEQGISEKDFMAMVIEEVNHKTLSIVGNFDDKMVAYVKTFVDNLWYYEEDEQRPLYVDIISHGGALNSLMAILDLLDRAKEIWDCKIITRCVGYAKSCGFILWCYGNIREMGRYSELMCHKLSYGINASLDDHDRELKRSKKLQDKIDKIIMEKTGITKKQLHKWYNEGDHFIDFDEATKLGILTEEEEEVEEENKKEEKGD